MVRSRKDACIIAGVDLHLKSSLSRLSYAQQQVVVVFQAHRFSELIFLINVQISLVCEQVNAAGYNLRRHGLSS